uniref:Uncharacterized protein n=1 Tax=Anguilla anguilla TaxID=7936 RepID=A0A0E9UHS5_ANGAN
MNHSIVWHDDWLVGQECIHGSATLRLQELGHKHSQRHSLLSIGFISGIVCTSCKLKYHHECEETD